MTMSEKPKPQPTESKAVPLPLIIAGVFCVALIAAFVISTSSSGTTTATASKANGVKPVTLTGQTFLRTIDSGVHVVDFWATWCGPCLRQAPVIDELAQEFNGRAGVGKIDVDAEPEISQAYRIESIPTIIVFKDGQEIKRFVGVTGKKELASAVQPLL